MLVYCTPAKDVHLAANKPLFKAFVDLEKAMDRVSWGFT